MCTWTEWLLVFLLFEQKIPTSTLYYPATSLRQSVQEKHTSLVCVQTHTPLPQPATEKDVALQLAGVAACGMRKGQRHGCIRSRAGRGPSCS